MNRAEINAKLKEGIALAQAGQRTEARRALLEVARADPGQELAWLWLASVSTDRAERVSYLERALAINPDNPTTQRAYQQLTGKAYAAESAAPAGDQRTGSGWLSALGREAPISLTNFLAIMLLATVAVIVIVVVVNMRSDKTSKKKQTAPSLVLPVALPTATPSISATPSRTPFPTITLGPSPTSVWNVAPTWTPSAIPTQASSSTPRPTASDTPVPTETMTFVPSTATFTAVPATATRKPPQPVTRTPDTATPETPEAVELTATETPAG